MRADTLWLCSALKGVMAWDGKARSSRFEEQADVCNRPCQSIFTDSRGRVWIGLPAGGVAVHERGTFRVFGERDGLAARHRARRILEDSSGGVWVGTAVRGVSRYQNGRFTSITPANAPARAISCPCSSRTTKATSGSA